MTKVSVRGQALWELTDLEKKQFSAWAWAALNKASFDTGILGYPRCALLITETDHVLSYLPVQTVLMAEAFIPNPDSSNKEKAVSLGRIDDALMECARGSLIGDVYMYTQWHGKADEQAWIDRLEGHGWEEITNVRLFKKRTGVAVSALSDTK